MGACDFLQILESPATGESGDATSFDAMDVSGEGWACIEKRSLLSTTAFLPFCDMFAPPVWLGGICHRLQQYGVGSTEKRSKQKNE